MLRLEVGNERPSPRATKPIGEPSQSTSHSSIANVWGRRPPPLRSQKRNCPRLLLRSPVVLCRHAGGWEGDDGPRAWPVGLRGRHKRGPLMDVSALNGAPPRERAGAPFRPIHVSGMAYAKIIDGMINVGYYAERATPDGGSERGIVAKLVFPGTACTVARASRSTRLCWRGPCARRPSGVAGRRGRCSANGCKNLNFTPDFVEAKRL